MTSGAENNLKLDVLSTDDIIHNADIGMSIFSRLFKLPISCIDKNKLQIRSIEAFINIMKIKGIKIETNITDVVAMDVVSIDVASDESAARESRG